MSISLEEMTVKKGTNPDANGLHVSLDDEFEDALEEIVTALEKNWKKGE